MSYSKKEFPTIQILELACSAFRVNKGYVKETMSLFDSEGKYMGYTHNNKTLMLSTVGVISWESNSQDRPANLVVTAEDEELAQEIKKYYRRLMFSAITGDNDFQTKVNSLLESDQVKENEFGWVACLPSVYKRDYAVNQTEKRIKDIDNTHIGKIGESLLDKDCEILSSNKSKNFEGYNVDAIIDNRLVSWMNKSDLKPGNCVVVKARVKDHGEHWKHKVCVTRLNYVKAVQ